MTDEPPPPWAVPDPRRRTPPVPPVPAPPEAAAPEQEQPDDAPLFPASPVRARARPPLPDLPRNRRLVGPQPDPQEPQPAANRPPPGRRPPPMPAPSEPRREELPDPSVGVVAGPVATTRSKRSFPGFPLLAAAAVVTMAATLGRGLLGDVSGPAMTGGVVVPLAVVIAVAVTLRAVGRDASVTVHRFRVQPANGHTASYVLEGDVPPGALSAGDLVRVVAGQARAGPAVARSVQVLATLSGPVLRVVPSGAPTALVVARWLSRLSIALSIVLLAYAAGMVLGAF